MNRLSANITACKTAAVAALTCAAFLVTGCGLGTSAAPSPNTIPSFSGRALGGATPIIGATVKIYATTSTAYGTGTLLQEANQKGASLHQDTDSNGDFVFAGGYDCPAGQFAYITIAGGNTGSNAVNSNALEVAALGRCEDLYSNLGGGVYSGWTGSYVNVSEVTTIAAAYALGHFSSVSGSGASAVVGIGADSTNNAAQVSGVSTGCVSGVGSCSTTATAGLAHAFQNAINLVSPFGGVANTTVPGSLGAVVPQTLINSIGNVLTACINTAGGAAPGGVSDGSVCGNIFAATSVGTTPPTNTFSAMVNLAANPTLSGSTSAVSSFFNLASAATSIYSPAFTSATGLNDFSIAISYPATAYTGINFPMSGALDINDNYYVGNATDNSTSIGNPTTPVNILSFSSNGATYGSSATNSTLKSAYAISLDSSGNGYIGNGGGSGTNSLGLFSTSNAGVTGSTAVTTAGVLTTLHSGNLKVYGLAVDKQNNVWAWGIQQSNGTSNLYMNPGAYTSATAKTWTAEPGPSGAITVSASNFIYVAIDPNQNVWMDTGTSLYVVENNGSVNSPTYTGTLTTKTTSGNTAEGITFASSSPYVAWVSSYNTTPGIQAFTPTFDTNSIGVSSVTASTISQPGSITGSLSNEADGAGTIWVADTNSLSIQQYSTSGGTAYKFLPCAGGSSSTCTSLFASPLKPQTLSIDSTGSIWVALSANGYSTSVVAGDVAEIIGSATPTWPLLSLGMSGQKP